MAGTVTLAGQLNQLNGPSPNIPIGPTTITPNASNEASQTNVKLVSGPNTITVPTWAAGCIIQPDPTNTIQVTYKGVSGDTGTVMSLTGPWELTFPATPPASFVLTAASNLTTFHNILFF